jgi:hypothetical protein
MTCPRAFFVTGDYQGTRSIQTRMMSGVPFATYAGLQILFRGILGAWAILCGVITLFDRAPSPCKGVGNQLGVFLLILGIVELLGTGLLSSAVCFFSGHGAAKKTQSKMWTAAMLWDCATLAFSMYGLFLLFTDVVAPNKSTDPNCETLYVTGNIVCTVFWCFFVLNLLARTFGDASLMASDAGPSKKVDSSEAPLLDEEGNPNDGSSIQVDLSNVHGGETDPASSLFRNASSAEHRETVARTLNHQISSAAL